MELVLIGTDHSDWKGKERLECILQRISPDVVAVEMGDTELQFLERASRLMEDDAPKEHIESYIAPYRGTFVGARDDYMAAEVRETIIQYPTSRLAIVIGWTHMLDDPKGETLYSRIKDLKPQRLLLH